MKAELIPLGGGPPIRIVRDVTVVGRRDYCDLQIDDPSLSRRHCVLVKTDGLLIVRDLATTNGTKVKGQRIRWAALLPDDRLAFGGVKFRVYLGPDDVPSPSEQAPGRIDPDRLKKVAAATAPKTRSAAASGPSKRHDFDDVPILLDEAAWREALSSDDEDGHLIIDLD